MTGLRVLLLGAVVLLLAWAAWARVGTLVQQAPPRAKPLSNPFEGQERATGGSETVCS